MALHSADWIRLLITFLPDILGLFEKVFKEIPREEIAGIAAEVGKVTKKIEEVSTGGQKETWRIVNKGIDVVAGIENP